MKKSFLNGNIDPIVVQSFGEEWQAFDQSSLSSEDGLQMFNEYFSIFPWQCLPKDAVGLDIGCGSGRWARLVAPKIGRLYCIDPSVSALNVARKNLSQCQNCEFILAGVENIPLGNATADFGYALGVLHHIPDPEKGIRSCVEKLKSGAPFLLYMYYAFDNKPWWYRWIWKISELGRFLISRLPFPMRYAVSQVIALLIYLPLARFSLGLEKLGVNVDSIPLSSYRHRRFYSIRTDALDRFGTRLEQRFTKAQIRSMMENSGLEKIIFDDSEPGWVALGYKK
ncbi:2-polyprenyl-3-methyl-5-hydroxy-6-metoxy-1,4-benzoquinol methylase [Neosynechococcus sphagnicola sy1]|uniref:2-polyprenyl-3-methyl-5-hydroxy-6-metoxy-1, 4-benzoquinol methylase n=1 Tax=Neosynechococcus sphagnicola sy1 TaxID=1497020 RepID=A0A098TKJ4_9CYAN|nr:class I SAM-dependent methyltransferase [Neosynechococcus sphagnicola]KGF72372.1 2-polyprenyl-3-methyl-5-hydroxy-6-metoxy-1,4-benzoquinol methylase [Neosynechococcus sphagnicola sy1]